MAKYDIGQATVSGIGEGRGIPANILAQLHACQENGFIPVNLTLDDGDLDKVTLAAVVRIGRIKTVKAHLESKGLLTPDKAIALDNEYMIACEKAWTGRIDAVQGLAKTMATLLSKSPRKGWRFGTFTRDIQAYGPKANFSAGRFDAKDAFGNTLDPERMPVTAYGISCERLVSDADKVDDLLEQYEKAIVPSAPVGSSTLRKPDAPVQAPVSK